MTITSKDSLKCEICEKVFLKKGHLNGHKLIHTGEKPFECDLCDSKFNRKSSLKRHKHIHSEVKPHTCKVCEKSFCDVGSLKVHMRCHTGEKPYSCIVCDKRYADYSSLASHRELHTGEKFACDKCDSIFSRKKELNSHKRKFSGKPPFKCDKCDAKFCVYRVLQKHMRIHTNVRIVCKCCDEEFENKSQLEKHRRIQREEKPFSCKVCQKRFVDDSQLKSHKNIHRKSYSCETCSKNFKSRASIYRHKCGQKRESKKSFSCDICGEKFYQKWKFLRHKNKHRLCKLCGQKFDDWIKHMKSHTKYECGICGKKFYYEDELKKHESSHVIEEPDTFTNVTYDCEKCDEKFNQKAGLKSHMQKHFEEEYGTAELHKSNVSQKQKVHKASGDAIKKSRGKKTDLASSNSKQSAPVLSNTNSAGNQSEACRDQQFLRPAKIVKCEECDKIFKDESLLNIHKFIHMTGESPRVLVRARNPDFHPSQVQQFEYVPVIESGKIKSELFVDDTTTVETCDDDVLLKDDLDAAPGIDSLKQELDGENCQGNGTQLENSSDHIDIVKNEIDATV